MNKNKKGIIALIGLFLISLVFGMFICNGHVSKAIDIDYDDFAPLKINGGTTTLDVQNSLNINSPASPQYTAEAYKYIKGNKLVVEVTFDFNCQGVARELADTGIVRLLGKDWMSTLFVYLVEHRSLPITGDQATGFKATNETSNYINSLEIADWQMILQEAFRISAIDFNMLRNLIANVGATINLMQNQTYRLEDLPSSNERLIYYCASSSDSNTFTSDTGLKDYLPYFNTYDTDVGYITSFIHIFSSYQLLITATLDKGVSSKQIKNFEQYLFPAYYDLNKIEGSNVSLEEALVPAGDRTQALFCKDWQEGFLKDDGKYYGKCNGGYDYFKNENGKWKIKKELDLQAEIYNYNQATVTPYILAEGPHTIDIHFNLDQDYVNYGFVMKDDHDINSSIDVYDTNIESSLENITRVDRNMFIKSSYNALALNLKTYLEKICEEIKTATNAQQLEKTAAKLEALSSLFMQIEAETIDNSVGEFIGNFLATLGGAGIGVGLAMLVTATGPVGWIIGAIAGGVILAGAAVAVVANLEKAANNIKEILENEDKCSRVMAVLLLMYTSTISEFEDVISVENPLDGLLTYNAFINKIASFISDDFIEKQKENMNNILNLYASSIGGSGRNLLYKSTVATIERVTNDASLSEVILSPMYNIYIETCIFSANMMKAQDIANKIFSDPDAESFDEENLFSLSMIYYITNVTNSQYDNKEDDIYRTMISSTGKFKEIFENDFNNDPEKLYISILEYYSSGPLEKFENPENRLGLSTREHLKIHKAISIFYEYAYKPYSLAYDDILCKVITRPRYEIYDIFVKMIKSKSANEKYTNKSWTMKLIIDRTATEDLVFDDGTDSSWVHDSVANDFVLSDTNVNLGYDEGNAKFNYGTSSSVSSADKLITNKDYQFSFAATGDKDARIQFMKPLIRYIEGSGVDHYEYIILKNGDKGLLDRIYDFNIYGETYEKVDSSIIQPGYTNVAGLFTKVSDDEYVAAEGIAMEGVDYYELINVNEMWREWLLDNFATNDDMLWLIQLLTSMDDTEKYDYFWKKLALNKSLSLSEDGEYIIIARSVDFVGNKGPVTYRRVLIDQTTPEIGLEFFEGESGDAAISTNEQYVDLLENMENKLEDNPYSFVVSTENLVNMNVYFEESGIHSSGLLKVDNNLAAFKMCVADIMEGNGANKNNCLDLTEQFYTSGIKKSGYFMGNVETELTEVFSWNGNGYVLRPSKDTYKISIDLSGIATIYRISFEITDVAGNTNIIRILAISNMSDINIETQTVTDVKFNLNNPDNMIESFDIELIYPKFVVGDLVYDNKALYNEVDGNYFDLNDKRFMTTRYAIVGKNDREKFYSGNCDFDISNPTSSTCFRDNKALMDRFIQEKPSNDVVELISSTSDLFEERFIFQQFELKIGGSKRDYSYIVIQEFEYSTDDLKEQLSFVKDEHGRETGNIIADPHFAILSSEKYEIRLKFIDYSKLSVNSDYGCYTNDVGAFVCDNSITKIIYAYDLYRLGITSPSDSKQTKEIELDTHNTSGNNRDFTVITNFDDFDIKNYKNNIKYVVKDEKGNYLYTEYYIYIDLFEAAKELKFDPTFAVNNLGLQAIKNIKGKEEVNNLTSTYNLLEIDDIGFNIYTNYLDDGKDTAVPNLGAFEYDSSMNVKVHDGVQWTNQSGLKFSLNGGSASFDYIFDPTLIYQYAVFKDDISLDYAVALIADQYNIDLMEKLVVCRVANNNLCTQAVENRKIALINEFIATLSNSSYNKLNRYLIVNGYQLSDVNMEMLKSLDIYSIEYEKIIAKYMAGLNSEVGIYSYLIDSQSDVENTLKGAISNVVKTANDQLWSEAYRIYSNMIGWETVKFDTNNKTTGVIDASSFINDTDNKKYVLVYRVVDVLGRSTMEFKKLTYFQSVPTITVEQQVMDLANSVFSSALSKTTLDEYLLGNELEKYFEGNEAYYELIDKDTISYCLMIEGNCKEVTNDLIKEQIFVGSSYEIIFSMVDFAGNESEISVIYKVVYSKTPTITVSTSDGFDTKKDINIDVVYTSIGGVDIKSIELVYCGHACLKMFENQLSLDGFVVDGNAKELKDLNQKELEALFNLLMSITNEQGSPALKLDLVISSDLRSAVTSKPVVQNGIYLVKVNTTNVPNGTTPPYAEIIKSTYSDVFVLDRVDDQAPLVLLGNEDRVNDTSYTSLLPNNESETTENYYFNYSNIFLFVKDTQVGINGSTVKLVKKVSKDCVFDPVTESEIQCFNSEIEAGVTVESSMLPGNVWKFDLSPNIRNRVGKVTYYLRASDSLGNTVYKRLDIQVDSIAPEINANETHVSEESISNGLYIERPDITIDFAHNGNISSGYEVASPFHKVVIYEPGKKSEPTVHLCAEYNNCTGIIKLKYNISMDEDEYGNRYYKNGMKEIAIELYDSAGNVSKAHRFNVLLDSDVPQISVKLSTDSVVNNVGQLVKINAIDSTSTIYKGKFAIDGVTHYGLGYRLEGTSNWVEVTDMSVLLIENGTYIFRAYDYALNYSEAKIKISNIDKKAPAITFSKNGDNIALPSHNIAIKAEDELSNIKVIKYCWIRTTEIDCTSYDYSNDLTTNSTKIFEITANKVVTKVIENGEYILSVYVEDIWGNSSSYKTKPFVFDCKKPKITPNITLNYNICAFENAPKDCFNSNTEMYEFLIELTDSTNILDLEISESAKVYISGYSADDIPGVYVSLDPESGEFVTTGVKQINYYDAEAGTYYLKYSVDYTDAEGRNLVEVAIVKIIIKDAGNPIITINENAEYVFTVGSIPSFADPGYGAYDVHDGDLGGRIKDDWTVIYFGDSIVSSIDTSVVGTYRIEYRAYDNAGNESIATRTVKFVDDVNPVISFEAGNDIEAYLVGSKFDYLKGLSIVDNYDGVIVENYVDENTETAKEFSKLGIYYYIYNENTKKFETQNSGLIFVGIVGVHKYEYRFTDKSGNETILERFIHVKDVVATMNVNGEDVKFDLTNNREDIVDGKVTINPNGLNLKINGVAYTEEVELNKVGKHAIVISDNFGNEARYSIYMDTSDTEMVLVDKTKVKVEKTIIKNISTDTQNSLKLDLTAELAEGGSLAKYANNPDYVIVFAIFCDDLNNTNGVACSDNYLELSVMENLTNTNSVVSLGSISGTINLVDSEVSKILSQTKGEKIALLVMSAEESASIAQAQVNVAPDNSKKVSLFLIIGIPAILGLYVLIRIFKFKKSVKAM